MTSFKLAAVVPWGRSFDEYRGMFALTAHDLECRILGCADGPASFNAELTAAGGRVTSCDPLYRYSAAEIRRRVEGTATEMICQARQNAAMFAWGELFADPDDLGRQRLATMERFLSDYEPGRTQGRYLAGELPRLPFNVDAFELAVCSHFLFLYSDHLTQEFHLAAIHELLRVAPEVRIFPITDLAAVPSRYIESVTSALVRDGCQVFIESVGYEFQRGGNQMMRIMRGE